MIIQINEELLKKTTPRERQIVALIARGFRTADIARELCVSRDTIESHRHKIIKKTGLKTSPSIVAEFQRGRLIYWCAVQQTWVHAETLPNKVAIA